VSPFVDINFEIISGLFVESARGPKRHRQETPPQTPPGFQRSITDRISILLPLEIDPYYRHSRGRIGINRQMKVSEIVPRKVRSFIDWAWAW
jgi:hypothetical protein